MKKRYTLGVLLLLLLSNITFAQKRERKEKEEEEEYEQLEHANEKNEYVHAHSSWYKEMMKARPDLQKAEKAFNDYFSKHAGEDSKLKSRFVSWIQVAALYKDQKGFGATYPAALRAPYVASKATGTASVAGYFGNWKMIGPANMVRQACNNSNMVTGGFCDRVFVNPYNTSNLFAGFSYGGLWVSTDQGASWQLTDGSFANGTNTYANRDYYYGEIEAHKLDSTLVFAATEAGLLKSTNSGITWTLLPQLNRNTSATERPYFIALAGDDKNVVLSTFGRKVYRSADGGNTWTMVFDNSGGGTNHTSTSQYTFNTPYGLNDRCYNFFGLEANLNNANEFYLGVWNSSNKACIYKSTDKGQTWSLLLNLNTALGTSWGTSTVLQMKAVPSSTGEVNIFEQFASNKPRYRYAPNGTLLGADTIRAYVEAFDIDWKNRNTMYQGQYSPDYITKSVDSGATFVQPYTVSCHYLHPDIRGISAVGNIVLVGNDGGLGLSLDGGKSIAGTGFEINSMDMWGFSSAAKSDICLTGLDHNQTFVRSFDGFGGWRNIKGADAGPCTINPYNDHWLYYDWAYGVNKGYLNSDGSVTESSVSNDADLGALQFNPFNAFTIWGIKKSNNNVLVISSDNMVTTTTVKDFGAKINAVRPTRTDARTLYVLLTQNKIMKTTDSGATWVNVTPSSSASGGQTNITAIEVGKTPGELWAAYGNAQNATKVLYSTDGGSSWTNITTSNLPAAAVSDIAYQRGTNGGVYIFVITSSGATVWYRNNSMPQWQQVGGQLPLMGYLKSRLFVVPAKNKIRFGSSRGAWETDTYESSGVVAGIAAENTLTKCSQDNIRFRDNSAFKPGAVQFQWSFPGGSPATSTLENPNVSYNNPGTYSVALTVTDADGNKDSTTLNNFIQVQASECALDTVAGKAADLTAVDNYYNIAPITNFNSSNRLTMTIWVKPSGIQTDYSGIFINNSTRTGVFVKNGSNELGYMWHDKYWGTNSGLKLPAGQWSHVAWVITPDSCYLYLNGKGIGFAAANDTLNLSAANWQIGTDRFETGASSRNFNGQVDELCIYNRALNRAEIRDRMHFVRNGTEAGLVGYYQFNESSPAIAYNKVGSANAAGTGTITQIVSPIPVATGVSQRLTVSAAGTYDFTAPGVGVTFASGTLPNGEVIVNRLYAQPDTQPDSTATLAPVYFVLRNFGTNDTITALTAITFRNLRVSGNDSANLSLLNLYKRSANATGSTWSNACTATSASSGDNGTVTFGSGCNLSWLGQFAITSQGTSFDTTQPLTATAISKAVTPAATLSIYPNPVNTSATISYLAAGNGTASIRITDVKGTAILRRTEAVVKGANRIIVNTASMAAGSYIVTVSEGGKMVSKEMVIAR
ncbi:LamG-like jellyroll fold domain-containing protein [Chitinophaga vietnamensis]|uniref:LamG-like jellyroll fold domain-containing protein n=1 Tax=Chitinophaga vietnamensis TaxID=2593957 RepID=UPI001177C2DC|nr:LamG-like jellyroll fold domain-containing protein [Chitinophaga vietnamensis]